MPYLAFQLDLFLVIVRRIPFCQSRLASVQVSLWSSPRMTADSLTILNEYKGKDHLTYSRRSTRLGLMVDVVVVVDGKELPINVNCPRSFPVVARLLWS